MRDNDDLHGYEHDELIAGSALPCSRRLGGKDLC